MVSIWIDKHVCRLHIITEDSKRTCVVNAVSGYLLEPMTGNKPPPNINIVAGKVPLGFKMEEITCTVEQYSRKFNFSRSTMSYIY
jgi:hypothetical protein